MAQDQNEILTFDVKPPDNGSQSTVLLKTPMDLLAFAVQNRAAIDVIERLSALQEKALARDAEIAFNDAMNAAQQEIPLVAPDLPLPHGGKKYGSYKALNRVVRPIYIKHGFSLSFNSGDAPPGFVKALCRVSRGGHSVNYQSPNWPMSEKGAKGGEVMTASDACGAAMSRAKRYLLTFIFNIVVGEDDAKWDGLNERLHWIADAPDLDRLQKVFKSAYAEAFDAGDLDSCQALVSAKDKRKKELQ